MRNTRGLTLFLQIGPVSIRAAGYEKPPDTGVQGDLADQSSGQLRVRAAQLAPGHDGQLEIPPQADAAPL
jgi:hypothetical protein